MKPTPRMTMALYMAVEQARAGKTTLINSLNGDVVIIPKQKLDELQEGKEKIPTKIFKEEL